MSETASFGMAGFGKEVSEILNALLSSGFQFVDSFQNEIKIVCLMFKKLYKVFVAETFSRDQFETFSLYEILCIFIFMQLLVVLYGS